MIIIFFVVNELLSILENMGLMGVKYPSWLKKSLEVMNKSEGRIDSAQQILTKESDTDDSSR